MNIEYKEVIKDALKIENDNETFSERFDDFMEELVIEQQGGVI